MGNYSVKNVGRKAPKFNGVVPYTSVDVGGKTLKQALSDVEGSIGEVRNSVSGLASNMMCMNTITVTPATNGTISASTGIGYKNQVVTLTAVADEGYEFTSWSVKKADNTDVQVTDNTFVMPDQSVTVSATFTAIPQPEAES